jgi:hypothetical protein
VGELAALTRELVLYDGDLAGDGVLRLLAWQAGNASLDFWWD